MARHVFVTLPHTVYFLQASCTIESDEKYAAELQQEEFALLDDSHVARTLQVIH